jgi:hypothetical protein
MAIIISRDLVIMFKSLRLASQTRRPCLGRLFTVDNRQFAQTRMTTEYDRIQFQHVLFQEYKRRFHQSPTSNTLSWLLDAWWNHKLPREYNPLRIQEENQELTNLVGFFAVAHNLFPIWKQFGYFAMQTYEPISVLTPPHHVAGKTQLMALMEQVNWHHSLNNKLVWNCDLEITRAVRQSAIRLHWCNDLKSAQESQKLTEDLFRYRQYAWGFCTPKVVTMI